MEYSNNFQTHFSDCIGHLSTYTAETLNTSLNLFLSLLGADGSQDRTIIDLLAGLEDDGFCKPPVRQNSQSQSFSGAGSYRCNSDEEEAGPELEKEEAELSFLMSQQWDNELENFSSIRQVISACLNGSLSFFTLQYFYYIDGYIMVYIAHKISSSIRNVLQ